MLDIVQEASRECVALAGHSTVAVKVVVRSPAIGADLTDYVTALFENFPELRRGVGSRKPTCHAYDRDMVPGSQITVPPPSVTCWMLADRQDSGRFPDRCRYGREPQSRPARGPAVRQCPPESKVRRVGSSSVNLLGCGYHTRNGITKVPGSTGPAACSQADHRSDHAPHDLLRSRLHRERDGGLDPHHRRRRPAAAGRGVVLAGRRVASGARAAALLVPRGHRPRAGVLAGRAAVAVHRVLHEPLAHLVRQSRTLASIASGLNGFSSQPFPASSPPTRRSRLSG